MDLSFAAELDSDDEAFHSPTPAVESKEVKVSKVPAAPAGRPPSKIHRHPGTRYFVIKSTSHKNLVLSIEHKVWATPRGNEQRLNEAFRTAPYVILLFSVNGSGCFQGYAKMLGPVGHLATEVFEGFQRGFEVRWLRLDDLDFSEVSGILNPWNENKSVKISRDGQELPNAVGRQVCELVDQRVFLAEPAGYIDDGQEEETGTEIAAPAAADPPALQAPVQVPVPAPVSVPPAPIPVPPAPVPTAFPSPGTARPAFPAPGFGYGWFPWPPPSSGFREFREPSSSSRSSQDRRRRRNKEKDRGGRKRRKASERAEPRVEPPTAPPRDWSGSAPEQRRDRASSSAGSRPPPGWLGAAPDQRRSSRRERQEA